MQLTVKAFKFLKLKNVSNAFSTEQLSFSFTISNKEIHTSSREHKQNSYLCVINLRSSHSQRKMIGNKTMKGKEGAEKTAAPLAKTRACSQHPEHTETATQWERTKVGSHAGMTGNHKGWLCGVILIASWAHRLVAKQGKLHRFQGKMSLTTIPTHQYSKGGEEFGPSAFCNCTQFLRARMQNARGSAPTPFPRHWVLEERVGTHKGERRSQTLPQTHWPSVNPSSMCSFPHKTRLVWVPFDCNCIEARIHASYRGYGIPL